MIATATLALSGCAPTLQPPSRQPMSRPTPETLHIDQIGAGMRRAFALRQGVPATPTPKTRVHSDRVTVRPEPGAESERIPIAGAITELDIPFAFNTVGIGAASRARLIAAVTTADAVAITIVGRSDASGAPQARERVARARAEALRAMLVTHAPDTSVHIELEVATARPQKYPAAYLRRATVRISGSPTHPRKETP